jgi:hypothetical protein
MNRPAIIAMAGLFYLISQGASYSERAKLECFDIFSLPGDSDARAKLLAQLQ